MNTLAEIEAAVANLPHPEQEVLLQHLSERLRVAPVASWPVAPPAVPLAELRKMHAMIDAEFSRVDATGW